MVYEGGLQCVAAGGGIPIRDMGRNVCLAIEEPRVRMIIGAAL